MWKRIFGRINKDTWMYLPAALLFTYLALRAKLVALNWDEAYTFFEFVRHPSWLPHDFNYMAANNHLLNTWLMKCSVGLFGQSELHLRLPNVLAGGVFFIYCIKILSRLFSNRWLVLAGFCLLTLNPFLLDFFSMARGYGISLALLMMALYFLLKTVEQEFSLRAAIRSQVLLVFAIAANLTLVNVLLPVTLLLFVLAWRKGPEKRWGRVLALCIVPALTVAALIPYYGWLKRAGALFYGEETSSLFEVFRSLAIPSAYGASYADRITHGLMIFFAVALLAPAILAVFRIRAFSGEKHVRYLTILGLLPLLCIAGSWLQHVLFGTNLLSGRTALFYFPLIGLAMLSAFPLSLRSAKIASGILSLAYLLHFSLTANTYWFIDFREQADVKEAMRMLKEENPSPPGKLFADVITTDLPYDQSINYYRMRFELDQFGQVARKEEIPGCSWYYLPAGEIQKRTDLTIVRDFPRTGTVLARSRDTTLTGMQCVIDAWQDFENDWPVPQIGTGAPYFGKKGTKAGGAFPYSMIARLEHLDTLTQIPAIISISCRLNTPTRNTPALLVLRFIDANGDDAGEWSGMHVSSLSVKAGEWSITNWTRPVPPGTQEIRLYIWNESQRLVYMDNVAMRLIVKKEVIGQ